MAGGGDDAGGDGDPAKAHERFALNVIPTEARAGFDVRIDPNTPTEDFKARLAGWCKEEGVTWELADWTTPLHEHYLTSVDREKNPWWGVFLVSFFFYSLFFFCYSTLLLFVYTRNKLLSLFSPDGKQSAFGGRVGGGMFSPGSIRVHVPGHTLLFVASVVSSRFAAENMHVCMHASPGTQAVFSESFLLEHRVHRHVCFVPGEIRGGRKGRAFLSGDPFEG